MMMIMMKMVEEVLVLEEHPRVSHIRGLYRVLEHDEYDDDVGQQCVKLR